MISAAFISAVIASFPGPTKAGEFGSMTWAISGKYI